jgi:hypothetical protein
MVSKQEGSTKLTSDTEPLQQLTNAIREREESKPASGSARLTPAEIAVILALEVLYKAGKPTTADMISKYLNERVQTTRNVLGRLVKRGLVISALPFGAASPLAKISVPPSQAGEQRRIRREKIYILTMGLNKIIDEYPEILDWVKAITKGEVKSKEELLKYIDDKAEEEKKRGRI